MCLSYDDESSRSFLKTHRKRNHTKIIAYKVVRVDNGKIYSPFFHYVYNIGKNVSGRLRKSLNYTEKRCESVRDGIHVFITRKDAELFAVSYETIMPVTCLLSDFVGCNKVCIQAVFTKVTVSKYSYNKALKSKLEKK